MCVCDYACVCVCVCVCVCERERERERERARGDGLRDWGGGGMRVCAWLDAGKGEGHSEICNALFNQVVYCCNVSCIAL